MTKDWSRFLVDAATKSDCQLEIEMEKPDHLGGNAIMRAGAKVEVKRRDREAATQLALKQLAIAEQQARSAKSAVRAASGSATAAVLYGILTIAISLWQTFHMR
jgi:hypothetical protein